MANPNHLAKIREGVTRWNDWRKAHPDILPDLSNADLSFTNLKDADLNNANLAGCVLSSCVLHNASFANSQLDHTHICDVDLSTAKGLENAVHHGMSYLDAQTLYKSHGKIPNTFLRGCGVPVTLIEYLPSLIAAIAPIQFYSVFLSYSAADEAFSRRLASRLRDEGVRTWFAPEDMKVGRKIHEQIDEAIRVYDKLILVVSDASMNSEWIKTEIREGRKSEARGKSRKIFPIRLVPM